MMISKRNGKPGASAVVTTLDVGEGQLSLDNTLLNAAQHFSLEIKLYNPFLPPVAAMFVNTEVVL